jgi:hypothetical protein
VAFPNIGPREASRAYVRVQAVRSASIVAMVTFPRTGPGLKRYVKKPKVNFGILELRPIES